MKDIEILETTGVKIDVQGREEVTIFGFISQFYGDCLAINDIFGLVVNFFDYHCSMFSFTKDSLNLYFTENEIYVYFIVTNQELFGELQIFRYIHDTLLVMDL